MFNKCFFDFLMSGFKLLNKFGLIKNHYVQKKTRLFFSFAYHTKIPINFNKVEARQVETY